jgi:hypothetical protein
MSESSNTCSPHSTGRRVCLYHILTTIHVRRLLHMLPARRAGGCELFPRDDDGRAVSEAVLLHLMLTATLDARMVCFTGLLDCRLG